MGASMHASMQRTSRVNGTVREGVGFMANQVVGIWVGGIVIVEVRGI